MISVRNRKKGFSLLEALLAIFLLASIVAYFISAFMVARHTSKLSRERIVISNLLRADMENFLGSNYSAIADGSVTTYIDIDDGTRTFQAVKTLDPETVVAGIYGYKKISGKIAWNGGLSGNKPLTEEVVVYVTKK